MSLLRCGALFACVAMLAPLAGQASGDPYIGIYHEPNEEPPGLLVSPVPGAPGALAGLLDGDVVTAINGVELAGSDTPFKDQLTEALAGLQVGEMVVFTVWRDRPEVVLSLAGERIDTDYPLDDLPRLIEDAGPEELVVLSSVRHERTLDIAVTLGARPGTAGAPFPPNAELPCDLPDAQPGVRSFLDELIDEAAIREDCDDLLARLNDRASPNDGYKLSRVVYLLRDGLKGEALARAISGELAGSADAGADGYWHTQAYAADLLDAPGLYASAPALRTGMSAEDHLAVLELILTTAALYVRKAFAGLSEEDLAFAANQRDDLTEVFRQIHYIDSEDEDLRRSRQNVRLVELAKKLDYEPLLLAQLTLGQIAEEEYLDGLKRDLTRQFADRLAEDDLLVRESELGKLVISGTGHTWRQGEGAALLIDLGGDDFYTTTAGSGVSLEHPVGVLLELGGDDAYESTKHYSQGSGSFGCGLLIDVSGNDQYVGLQWAQGCGFFGCGALLELAGDDIYRGEEFCQAAAVFGSGVLIDYAGDDRMEGQMKCQAFGGAHAVGLLVDVAGDDERYCKGEYPTGYGDPGIFDAWGQGCAMGFRGIASGGIAAVVDLAGSDYSEAGSFSQGGGYYFGFGLYHDRGWERDRYVGSRYNQGFCAHQAVGVFLEDAGDDWYQTRQAVAQGLAWDECCTMFVDSGGDDIYEGGTGFSQGASAHNSLCVMCDRGGRDEYVYPPGQARAGGNDYHGGTSLSLFIDEGGTLDVYDSERSRNDYVSGWPEHGFFADLPASLSRVLADSGWRLLWVEQDDSRNQ